MLRLRWRGVIDVAQAKKEETLRSLTQGLSLFIISTGPECIGECGGRVPSFTINNLTKLVPADGSSPSVCNRCIARLRQSEEQQR